MLSKLGQCIQLNQCQRWSRIICNKFSQGATVTVPIPEVGFYIGAHYRHGSRRHSCSSRSTMSHDLTYFKQCARLVFDAGVQAVLPNQMVKDALQIDSNTLTVNRQHYTLDHNVHIAAFGKAVIGMVRAAEDVLGDHLVGGVASIPLGIQKILGNMNKVDLLPMPGSKVRLLEGARDNLPDSASLQAAAEITALAERLTERDILLVLISGGGSALLPAPVAPISLEEKLLVIKALASRGASIEQLNTVRKNLSSLKGGKLAQIARPAKVISLILSDIIGDPLDLIGSAPTVTDQSTSKDCLAIFHEFQISEQNIPPSIFQHLRQSDALQQDQPRPTSLAGSYANNVIIGSNSIAVAGCTELAKSLGFEVFNISNAIDGEASRAAQTYVDIALFICEKYSASSESTKGAVNAGSSDVSTGRSKVTSWFNVTEQQMQSLEAAVQRAARSSMPVCIIGAGETTVTIRGNGQGGRNQELALAASIDMETSPKLQGFHRAGFRVVLLSAGTDGQDGPTDAAGAVADPNQVTRAKQLGLHPEEYLRNNDSYTFYKALGEDLAMTGLTGTNVMDLQILLVAPPQ